MSQAARDQAAINRGIKAAEATGIPTKPPAGSFGISAEGKAKAEANKSEARRDYQRKTLIKGLNESELITFEPRQIDHNIFVFTDVDCGYCRQFHNQIDEYLELGIRVNYHAYPRAGIGSDSFNKISSAWCNEDPNYSLTLLKQGQDIETKLCEDNPVEKHFNLGNTIGVQGTPSIITDEGKMIPGYLPPQDFLNILGTNS